jgi:hypothetical protein
MGIVYCFHDMDSWGTELSCELERRKASSQMMSHAVQVTDEKGVVAFLHVSAREQQYVKGLSRELAKKSNICLIPDAHITNLHDDLVQQYVELGQWMPSTYLIRSPEQASEHLSRLPYPIISRSSSAAQRGTRILNDPQEAFDEAFKVFSDTGLALPTGAIQKDYLLWQPAWETQGHIYHVFMLGKKYAVITVVPADLNPANNQNQFQSVDVLDDRFQEVLKYAFTFATDSDFDFVSMEVAPARDRVREIASPFILSVSASWPFAWFERGGMIFESKEGEYWESIGIPAVKIWSVVADWIIAEGKNAP